MANPDHCRYCPTRRLCLAQGLEGDSLTALACCVAPSEPMKRGDFLYRAGDPATDCYVVRSGAYKTVMVNGNGEEHVTGFHFPGDLMALAGQSDGRYSDSAVALDTSTACRVPLEKLPRLWSIGSGAPMLRLMGRSEQMGAEHHMTLSRTGADVRVAGFVVNLARRMARQGRATDSLPLPMSRTDLANHLGMTLECLSRVFAKFSKAGIITASRNQITQLQPERLESIAGCADV